MGIWLCLKYTFHTEKQLTQVCLQQSPSSICVWITGTSLLCMLVKCLPPCIVGFFLLTDPQPMSPEELTELMQRIQRDVADGIEQQEHHDPQYEDSEYVHCTRVCASLASGLEG